jgi:hypothetical protein
MRICDQWSINSNLSLFASQLRYFDFDAVWDPDPALEFDADPDLTFHCDADPDPASRNDADPDPQHWLSLHGSHCYLRYGYLYIQITTFFTFILMTLLCGTYTVTFDMEPMSGNYNQTQLFLLFKEVDLDFGFGSEHVGFKCFYSRYRFWYIFETMLQLYHSRYL